MASLVQGHVSSVVAVRGSCSLSLPGGRAGERVYAAWRDIPSGVCLDGVSLFFGDERCVPVEHPDSNCGLVLRTLLPDGPPAGCRLERIEAESACRESAAQRYSERLPDRLDLLLLGVGEDGHIASLFPGGEALREEVRRVVPTVGPKHPRERITITPAVIRAARVIWVLAPGPAKAAVLANAVAGPGRPRPPLDLVMRATWLLDTPLPPMAP